MVKQRPEVVLPAAGAATLCHASEKISDPAAIAALLSSCSALADESEDDLIFELLYLETLLASHPLKSRELLAELGTLGEEVREGLLPPGVVDMTAIRRRTSRLRQQMGVSAGRITAALLMLMTSLPFFGQEAQAANPAEGKTFQLAQAPVVRVVDANSGAGVSGVQIKSMEEKLLGVTDAGGQATLSEEYMETDLLSLEKDGYQMYLLDRTQLSTRNIVSMKPLKDGDSATALLQKAPTPPKAPEGPKVASGDGHKPTVTPPKPPVAPKAPQVQIPIRPKAPKQDATVAVKPPAPAAKPAAPKAVAPEPAAAPLSEPAKPRAPMAVAAKPVGPQAAPSVAVPKRVPAPQAAPVETAEAPTTSGSYYKVRSGDTLSALAQRHLGSAKRWPEIFEANRDKLKNPHWIAVGQELTIPGASKMAATSAPKTYVVKRGDSLSGIAGRELGSMSKWQQIYAANRSSIRNPHYIFPGQKLVIPG